MLEIVVPGEEMFNEETYEFVYGKDTTLLLEHSLVSIKKWEQKWHKPFLDTEKNEEELADYIKMMTITKNVEDSVYARLSNENIQTIKEYLQDPMTAQTFRKEKPSPAVEPITNELIYYWMITLGIPVEFQKWHLNSLLALIRVCNIKNQPPEKLSPAELAERNARLNAERKAKYNTRG